MRASIQKLLKCQDSKNTYKKGIRSSTKSKVALMIGLAIMMVFVVFAIFPSQISPYEVDASFDAFLECSSEHFLGTNNIGRDIFTEMVYATSSTLVIGLLSALITLVVGLLLGLIAGYFGGFVGEMVNGFINFFFLIPMIPLAIVIAAFLGAGQQNIILTISLLGWCGTARAIRAKTMQLKKMQFVEAVRGLGFSKCRIVFRHILPNLKEVALAKYIMSVATCMLLEATLSFLGLGNVSKVTWGSMINLAYKHGGFSLGAYNWFLAPGMCIVLLVLSFFLINYYFEMRTKSVSGGSYLD